MKNKHAQEMAKLRWKNTTQKQRSKHAKMMVSVREAKKNKARKISTGELA